MRSELSSLLPLPVWFSFAFALLFNQLDWQLVISMHIFRCIVRPTVPRVACLCQGGLLLDSALQPPIAASLMKMMAQ